MNKSTCVVDLRPNRLLLDTSFGGYKLSLDPIPTYQKPLEIGVDVVQPSDDQFSFYHVKIFSLHNHLHVNPHTPNGVYFVDKDWNIYKIHLSPLNQLKSLIKVFQIPKTNVRQKGNYNVSIKFPAATTAVVCDGAGNIHFIRSKNEEESETWEVINSECLIPGGCVLADVRFENKDEKDFLHILAVHVEEKKEKKDKDDKSGLFHTMIEWVTFFTDTWKSKSNKQITVDGSVDYLALEPGCGGVFVVSDKLPKWSYDSEKSIEIDHPQIIKPPQKKVYTWTQTSEEITMWLPFEEGTEKSDLTITVEDVKMEIKHKNNVIVSGDFYHRVDKNLTSWIFAKNRLEIQITKHESGLMWKSLLPDDDKGEEIIDPEVVKNIHEKLAHLCSDKEESGVQPSFNSQQLEDCDASSIDASLVRMDVESHTITHEVNLTSCTWLFKVEIDPKETPAICCRHDVDACVWQFKKPNQNDKTWPHEHVGTFSAFGYVQASKTQKKFVACPPDLSYVAVCETSHHVYIYRQPSPLNSELKNRHTGKKVDTISKQQLINLESNEPILGVHATNNVLYVLLDKSVRVLAINV